MQPLLDLIGAGHTVLAPTAEIAAGVLERVERAYLAQGRQVWPTPQIRDFSGWARQQYESHHFLSTDAPRVLDEIEERQLWREVIADSPIAAEFVDAGGAARQARAAVRAMYDHGIAVQSLHDYPGLETSALLQWIEAFDERCSALRVISADRVLQRLPAGSERPVPLDSPAWRPSALRWLSAHALPPQAPLRAAGSAATPRMRVFGTFDAEMAACAEWARVARLRDPEFRAWIGVPNLLGKRATVSNAFDAALVPSRLSMREFVGAPAYAIAGGTPLTEYEPVRTALACLGALSEALPFDQFSALLRAPALQGDDLDASAAARLDRALRTQGPNEASLQGWLDAAQRIAAGLRMDSPQALLGLQTLRERLPTTAPPRLLSQWAGAWIQALEVGPWLGRASWSSSAFQAAERLRELIGTLARGDAVFGALRLAAAVRALTGAASDTSFQPQTGLAPVWISAQLMDPWLSYDGIWIAGATAQTWPLPPAPLPLLPVQLQRQHAVPGSSAALQLQRAVDLQERWLQRTPEALFSCSTDTDLEAMPSALLTHFVESPASHSPCEPLWRSIAAAAAPLEAFTDEQGPAYGDGEATRGTRSLRDQSLCPFRGFATTRLRADPLEFPQPGFNALERGIILHESLQVLWQQLRSSVALALLDVPTLHGLIAHAVHAAVGAAMQRRDPGALWSRRETRRLLRLLPEWFALELRRESFEIEELESEHRVQLGGLRFNLRLDRVDRLSDGSLVLLDYKSGEVARDWADERPDNPQLPLYALSVGAGIAAVAYARISATQCRFLGLSERDKILPQVDGDHLEGGAGMAAQMALWAARLDAIAGELSVGDARVAPTRNACRNCSYPAFCRIAEQASTDDDAEP